MMYTTFWLYGYFLGYYILTGTLLEMYILWFDPQDYKNGRSKRFGFVEFESLESQQKALETDKHFIEGAKVKTKLRMYHYILHVYK